MNCTPLGVVFSLTRNIFLRGRSIYILHSCFTLVKNMNWLPQSIKYSIYSSEKQGMSSRSIDIYGVTNQLATFACKSMWLRIIISDTSYLVLSSWNVQTTGSTRKLLILTIKTDVFLFFTYYENTSIFKLLLYFRNAFRSITDDGDRWKNYGSKYGNS